MTPENPIDLFGRPALLFLPASNPRAIAKARESAADLVVLDLEDAVKAEDKDSARRAAIEALGRPWPMPVAIRVNGTGTRWHDADVEAAGASGASLLVVPAIKTAGEIAAVRARQPLPVAAMIEKAAAVLAVTDIAGVSDALIAGTNDLAADLRLPQGAGRTSMGYALQAIVLAARAAGRPVFDGVFNRIDDRENFAIEALESRALGFDGKSLIHPSQIEPCQAAFTPTREEIGRAERLVAAASGGAERFEGEMIESMHVEAARRLLDRAMRR
jgi:citrate lyase subunit beta/citryl-CoA lyase